MTCRPTLNRLSLLKTRFAAKLDPSTAGVCGEVDWTEAQELLFVGVVFHDWIDGQGHDLSQFTAPTGIRESDVALFLPLGRNKGEQTAATGGTKRR